MRLRAFLLSGLALLLGAGLLSAQVVTTGTVTVIVLDSGGARVPGAIVSARAADSVTSRTAETNAQGEAMLVALEPSAAYAVTTEMVGFKTVRNEGILVRSGQTTTLRVGLELSDIQEQVTVSAESPVVDTTSATTGQDITLELTESLPTGRSYQSYLQLVPGVMPDDPSDPGNPASKSGLNYRDIGGEGGVSRDNFYYIDGINVTDGVQGTFGANLNTEIIQEQKVLTGGIPAEYVGAPGLLSSVITKSGSNTFHGSVNYFFQNGGLVADDKNAPSQDFSTYDTAATLGGPIVNDQLWFFASYRRLQRTDDVAALDTGELLRTVDRDEDQWYARATWAPTANDSVAFTYFSDPLETTGSRDRSFTNARDRARKQGGDKYRVGYTRLFGNLVVDLAYANHDGEISDFSVIREPQNDILFRATNQRTLSDEQLGGYGYDLIETRGTELYKASFQWSLQRHVVKGGVEFAKNKNFRNSLTLDNAAYTSLASGLSGLTPGDIGAGSFSGSTWFDPTSPSDFNGFIRTVNGLPNRDSFYTAYDLNGDGVITPEELSVGLAFNSTAANPNGKVNYYRVAQVADGPQDTSSKGLSFYLQDSFQLLDRLTLNFGVRTERYEHFATDGTNIYTFDWTWAPRLSAVYDPKGDGRMKVSAYYGKYYDPIRNNMTNFAGTLSGRIREEQVFANGEWVNYRTRGGPQFADALFAPTTKTPWTEDIQLGFQADLGQNMSVEVIGTKRRTRDILEDYDLILYASNDEGVTDYPGPIDNPDSLYLGLDYFGYSSFPESNFVIGTLAGAKRDYKGVEFIFRKRFSNRWQGLASYTWNDATGNSNSDSNADFQGDVLYLDPRAPNQLGDQPGLIHHLIKVAGSYRFDFGLELGGVYRWNSGTLASRTELRSRRNLPIRVPSDQQFEYADFNQRWITPDSVGVLTNPSWGQLDLRVQYVFKLGQQARTEVFADFFNVFDNQGSIRNQDLLAGTGGIAFGEPILYNPPRRIFLGARVSF